MEKRQFQLSKRLLDCATALGVLLLCVFFCFHLYSVFVTAISRYDSWSREHTRALFLRTELESLFVRATSKIIHSATSAGTVNHGGVAADMIRLLPQSVTEVDGVAGFGHGLFLRGKPAATEEGEANFITQAKYVSHIEGTAWHDAYKRRHRFLVAADEDLLFSVPSAMRDWKDEVSRDPDALVNYISRVRAPILSSYNRATEKAREAIWTAPYSSALSETSVIGCYTPIYSQDGKLQSFLVGEVPVAELVDRQWLQKYSMSLALFNPDRQLVVADPELGNLDRIKAKALSMSGITNLDYVIDGKWLQIYVVAPMSSWRVVYSIPLSVVFFDNIVPVVMSVLGLFIGWFFIFLGALGFKKYLLFPAQKNVMKMSESRELIQVLMDFSPVGLCLIRRADGQVLIQNEQSRALLTLAINSVEPERKLQDYFLQVSSVETSGTCKVEVDAHEQASGKLVHVLAALVEVNYHDQPAVFCSFVDDSERKNAELMLSGAKAAADEANQAKSIFLAMMSHEIRTPLYGVLGSLELLGKTALAPQQRDHLKNIELSSSNLLQIINDILDYSKIEANQLALVPAAFNLVELIEGIVRSFSSLAEKKHVQLYCCLPPDVPLVIGDSNRLQQVLSNLLSNAVKFTDSGKIVVRLTPAPAQEGQLAMRLQVTDSGIGIARDSQEHLFEPFIQAENTTARRFGGTGLGLSICRQLVRLMGGEIELVSEVGLGSSFSVLLTLPIAGPAPSIRLSELATYHVLAEANDQRESILALIEHAGGHVQLIAANAAPVRDDVYLVVGWPQSCEVKPHERYAGVIWLDRDGLPTPQWQDDGWHVSSICQQGLLKALLLASGESPSESAASVQPIDHLPGGQKQLHVFAVEDHPINQIVLTEQLEQLGCRVTLASDGREALQLWQRGLTFDVLLTDVNMPNLDGYQLVRQLREAGLTTPIVGVTANAHAQEGERCRDAGMDAHLAKPVSLASLRAALVAVGVLVEAAADTPPESNIVLTLNGIKPAMRDLFISTTQKDWSAMLAALAEGDTTVVTQHAHRLKGALVTIGELDAAHLCSEIENQAQLGRLNRLDEHVQQLAQYLSPILEASS